MEKIGIGELDKASAGYAIDIIYVSISRMVNERGKTICETIGFW